MNREVFPPQKTTPAGGRETADQTPLDPPSPGPDYLDALLDAARFYGRPATPGALLRGLPLQANRLTADHLAEAAHRARLMVNAGPTSLKPLTPTSLPVLAELKDGRVVALLRQDGRGYVTGRGADDHDWISIGELEARGVKRLTLVRPAFFFDHRSVHYHLPQNKHWLIRPLADNAWIYGFAALAGLVINLVAIVVSMFSMTVYDRVIPNNSMTSLVGLLVGVLIVLTADLILKFIRGYLIDTVARRFDIRVGSAIFARMLGVGDEARPQSSGALANLVREFDTVRDFFASASLIVLADLPFVALFLAVIWWIGGALVFVPLAGVAVLLTAALCLQVPLGKAIAVSFREASQKSAFLHEAAVGLDTLKATNAQAWARRIYEHLIAQNAHTGMATRMLSASFANLSGTVSSLVTVGTVSYGAYLVAQGDGFTSGGIVACVILSGRTMSPFAQITGLMGRWQQTKLAADALDKLMVAPTEEGDGTDTLLQRFTVRGAIAFNAVCFTYPQAGGVMAPNEPALTDVSLEVPVGQSIGILGRVGSGKTTLLKLIARLHTPQDGNVRVDGVDVRQIHPAELRAQVCYVGQDAMLFHGTIRDNIVIGRPEASDDEVLTAARIAGLDQVLAGSALGLAKPVGERGQMLSGGQRQAVALARALVTDPAVLLLDEPTAMMDNTTEARFLAELAKARTGKTTLIVTHRPQVLQVTSRVIVIDGGRVALDGPRDEVLARLSGGKAASQGPKTGAAE
jgi:ATP-binding cassette subfamily C protein LapB